ncbi:MAG TPA: DUF308 domain-containing protein [Sphingomonas sp.]|nr:DUF308 domain-containing protein [Sphingomonas sp.]
MTMTADISTPNRTGLTRYYAIRAFVSILWVALALTIGKAHPLLGVALIIAYPAWDSLANYVDAKGNGGLRANPTQMLNVIVSAIVTLAVAVAVAAAGNFHVVIAIIGIWAALAGILQLSTAVRRWRTAGAQWPMILSGGQSALAGAIFVKKATDATASLSVADVAPYAAFGAFYFAISAAILFLKRR